MQKEELKILFQRMVQAFNYSRTNYLNYQKLDSNEGHYLHNLAPDTAYSFLFASQMSSILVVANLLADHSNENNYKNTMTFAWLFKKIENLPTNFRHDISRWKEIINSIDTETKNKIKTFRNKYYAHMDEIMFSLDESKYLISYDQFDAVLTIIEEVISNIYMIVFDEKYYKYENKHTDFENVIDSFNKRK